MKHVKHLQCMKCSKTYSPTPGRYTCDACGPEGVLDVVYDYEIMAKTINKKGLADNQQNSMWRYLPFLPLDPEGIRPPLRVGWSPLYRGTRLEKAFGFSRLYLKDDGLNPTASLKDRASVIAVAKALQEGCDTVACASTGNAASSLAGSAAAAGLKSVIFVPDRAPQGKIAQLKIFGAQVLSVRGSYQQAFALSAYAIEKYGWYNRNAAINPYLVEGKKTVSLEIAEQLNWEVPDWVAVSVGDGCTIAGVYKGFRDLLALGFIARIPRLLSVQASGCYPINRAFRERQPIRPMEENTLADSIAVGVPRNPDKAILAIKESQGMAIEVSDEEILEAMRVLGSHSGVFGEPAGAASLAGVLRARSEGRIAPTDTVVCCITGNGLKDVANGIKAAGEPISVGPKSTELANIFSK